MRFLLDTHIVLWAIENSPRLPESAKRRLIDPDNEFYISAVSLWEIELKHLKNPKSMPLNARKLASYCKKAGFIVIPVKQSHIFRLSEINRSQDLPPHKDPFDKMLISQAVSEDMILLTHDSLIKDYPIKNIIYV